MDLISNIQVNVKDKEICTIVPLDLKKRLQVQHTKRNFTNLSGIQERNFQCDCLFFVVLQTLFLHIVEQEIFLTYIVFTTKTETLQTLSMEFKCFLL